jgi:hypothetical protein
MHQLDPESMFKSNLLTGEGANGQRLLLDMVGPGVPPPNRSVKPSEGLVDHNQLAQCLSLYCNENFTQRLSRHAKKTGSGHRVFTDKVLWMASRYKPPPASTFRPP